MHNLSDYDYDLPQSLIAQNLASPADNAKLLVVDKNSGSLSDHVFNELPGLIPEGSHLFFNTSKVVKARIAVPQFEGEIFFLETTTDQYTFEALVRPGKKMKVGHVIAIEDYSFEIIGMTEQGRLVKASHPILEILEQIGQMPLPPYIEYDASKSDSYQPLQAKQPGSVAAPTASLHFTKHTFDDLKARNCKSHEVVLHIGLGTFKQVDTESIQDYGIHSERVETIRQTFERIATIKQGDAPLIAVGTTVTRSLESLPYLRVVFNSQAKSLVSQDAYDYREKLTTSISLEQANSYIKSRTVTGKGTITSGESGGYDVHPDTKVTINFESTLYIYPGFEFKVVDQLITNFHLPKSSLLMLVAGFVGYDKMREIYQYAIQNEYMFYSFGDAMIIK